jgi:two-component system response regulator HydG
MSSDGLIAAAIRTATADGIGMRVFRDAERPSDAALATLEHALAAHGFVVVHARGLLRERAARMAGRHVALVCPPEDANAATASCVRWLGRTSPRAHLVLLLGWDRVGGAAAARDSVARERAWSLTADAGEPRAIKRAQASERRGRLASAERWFRAAMTAARGHGDERVAGQCCERLVDLLLEQRQARRAWSVAITFADELGGFHPRSSLLTAAAGALMAGGEFDRAEAVLAALDAEAVILGEELPAVTEARHAELMFWRGRFDRAPPIAGLRSAEAVGWCGLAAWARGDHDTLSVLLDLLQQDEAGFWTTTLRALAHPGRPASVVSSADKKQRYLARAIEAEVLLAAGQSERALGSLVAEDTPAARAESLLHEWLKARCRRDAAPERDVRLRVHRAGLRGVLRWGEGKDGMHLIHGLPALLQLVQDADDDQAALKGSCDWLRRQTGAQEVAILTADENRVIASEGWSGSDDVAGAVAPVRYGRAVIGRVVARGADANRAVIEQGVQAIAALVAPAIRSRLDALELSRDANRAVAEILGASPAIAAVREAVARAAQAGFPVLVEGESGTGKELVARAVHRLSARRDRPFAAVNCAALSDELVEAELFGHARGAFTGALGMRAGIFEWAHGGTLFLDEVGELSPRGQAKVLRALQEREIRRLGENAPRPVDVRVVAATNVVLTDAVVRGAFRQDLLFRLAVVRIRIPPLRERLEDIPRLAHAFWKPLAAGRNVRATLGADALAALCRHAWPGNVRELQNAIAGLVVSAPARGRVTERHVRQVLATTPAGDAVVSLEAARAIAERRAVASALARHGGRRSAAATDLGISRQGLAKALRRLGLDGLDARAGVA